MESAVHVESSDRVIRIEVHELYCAISILMIELQNQRRLALGDYLSDVLSSMCFNERKNLLMKIMSD